MSVFCACVYESVSVPIQHTASDLTHKITTRTHLHGDGEVDDRDLDAHFWQVVGVAHLGGDEQLEVRVVVNVCVTQTNEAAST